MPVSSTSAHTTARQLFSSIDKDRDQRLSRTEVKRSIEDAGVGGGFFGGMKVDGATDAVMDNIDRNGDDRISWSEYVKKGHTLAPAGMPLDPAKMQDPAHVSAAVDALYRDADRDRDGALSHRELAAHQTRVAEDAGQSNASTRGDIAATLAMKKLDANHDGRLQRDELKGFLSDIAKAQATRS